MIGPLSKGLDINSIQNATPSTTKIKQQMELAIDRWSRILWSKEWVGGVGGVVLGFRDVEDLFTSILLKITVISMHWFGSYRKFCAKLWMCMFVCADTFYFNRWFWENGSTDLIDSNDIRFILTAWSIDCVFAQGRPSIFENANHKTLHNARYCKSW